MIFDIVLKAGVKYEATGELSGPRTARVDNPDLEKRQSHGGNSENEPEKEKCCMLQQKLNESTIIKN